MRVIPPVVLALILATSVSSRYAVITGEYAWRGAIRRGDWKLIPARGNGEGPELYNLGSDIREQHNLAAQHPAKEACDASPHSKGR